MANALAPTMLLIEDNEMDVLIFKRALRKLGADNPLEVAHDGIEALAALQGTDGKTPVHRPNVIVLDLNMPRMNGIEFLDELRADPALRDLVVFVLTTSDSPKDKQQAYQRNIAGYLVKSISGQGFTETVDMLGRYTRLVDLPT